MRCGDAWLRGQVKRLAAETLRQMARDEDMRADGRKTRQVMERRGGGRDGRGEGEATRPLP